MTEAVRDVGGKVAAARDGAPDGDARRGGQAAHRLGVIVELLDPGHTEIGEVRAQTGTDRRAQRFGGAGPDRHLGAHLGVVVLGQCSDQVRVQTRVLDQVDA